MDVTTMDFDEVRIAEMTYSFGIGRFFLSNAADVTVQTNRLPFSHSMKNI